MKIEKQKVDLSDFKIRRERTDLDEKKKELMEALEDLDVSEGFELKCRTEEQPDEDLSYNAMQNVYKAFNRNHVKTIEGTDSIKAVERKVMKMLTMENTTGKTISVRFGRVE